MNKINIIYTCDTWELDWLQTVVFKGVDYELIIDTEFITVLPNSVIVMNETDESKITQYINKFKAAGYKYGIIHLSDETYSHPINHYSGATFILRNYYSKQYAKLHNVDFIPLGYSSGFIVTSNCKLSVNRKYFWNFIGQIANKPTRESMVNALSEIDGGYLRPTRRWNDSNGLKIQDYLTILEDSIFTPAPAGWCNPDSFRLYEALEAGSIPIVDNKSYFTALYGPTLPFPSVKNWNEVVDIIQDNNLYIMQLSCMAWWRNQKDLANKKFKAGVAKFFEENPIRLNLGCGDIKLPGYINLDINEKDKPDVIIKDITHLPYSNDTIDEIRADAMYEHLRPSQQVPMLLECKRILKSGGILNINWLPDFEVYARAYIEGGPSIYSRGHKFSLYDAYRFSHGDADNPKLREYRGDYQLHRDIFDKNKVKKLLDLSGPWSNIDIQNIAYADEPLAVNINIQVIK